MRVNLAQVASPADETLEQRVGRVERMLECAQPADLVVLPELWATGYFAFDRYATDAEPIGGRLTEVGSAWARSLNAYLHFGSIIERAENGSLFNTSMLFGPGGNLLQTYRKIHLFGHGSSEAQLLSAGTSWEVVATPFGPIASVTCYDLRFPELWRALIDAGAKVVLVPAAWPAARVHHWRLFTSCRAAEEQIILIAANAAGEQHGQQLAGSSRVVDPTGNVILEGGMEEGVIACTDLEPSSVDRARRDFQVLRDRRLDLAELQGWKHPDETSQRTGS